MVNYELKSERVKHGMTTWDMARICGLKNAETYRLKENGKVKFDVNQIVMISIALDFDLQRVNEIFFEGKLPTGKLKDAV